MFGEIQSENHLLLWAFKYLVYLVFYYCFCLQPFSFFHFILIGRKRTTSFDVMCDCVPLHSGPKKTKIVVRNGYLFVALSMVRKKEAISFYSSIQNIFHISPYPYYPLPYPNVIFAKLYSFSKSTSTVPILLKISKRRTFY